MQMCDPLARPANIYWKQVARVQQLKVIDVLSASCIALSRTCANNLSREVFRRISKTLAEKSFVLFPLYFPTV